MKVREAMTWPAVNVQILYKKTDGTIIKESGTKNRVLLQYGLYSYVRFILGSFNNGSLWDWNQYVPKYLAVGSNQAPMTGAPGTETGVQVTDISLYHELSDSELTGEPGTSRIKLNRANYVEDNEKAGYIKVQYEAYIPENRFVGMTIGEMALMTMPEGYSAFARITGFEPFVKEPNTVVQVIWSLSIVSVESSERYAPPIKTYLKEAIEKAIDILCVDTIDPVGLEGARVALNKLLQPALKQGTGMYYLLNNNEFISQDTINNYLSKPFVSIDNTGLIPLIHKFPSGENWEPSSTSWNASGLENVEIKEL